MEDRCFERGVHRWPTAALIAWPVPSVNVRIWFTSTSTIGGRAGTPLLATFPRRYQVQVSADGNTWSAPVSQGEGSAGTMLIAFAPTKAKFIRITQTASVPDAPPWSMRLLRLYQGPIDQGGRK